MQLRGAIIAEGGQLARDYRPWTGSGGMVFQRQDLSPLTGGVVFNGPCLMGICMGLYNSYEWEFAFVQRWGYNCSCPAWFPSWDIYRASDGGETLSLGDNEALIWRELELESS